MNSSLSSFASIGVLAWCGLSGVTGCGESGSEPTDGGSGAAAGSGTGGSGAGRAGATNLSSGGQSAGSGGNASGGAGGTAGGGSGASGGDAGNGTAGTGTAGKAGSGGTSGAAAVGASGANDGGAGAAGDDGSAQSGAGGGCNAAVLVATPGTPTVELLVDTSSSMFETEPTSWSVLYDALMNPTNGVVHALEGKIRFGFSSYKGHQGTSESDPACATMTDVAPALDNYAAIDAVYQPLGGNYSSTNPTPQRWETPTNYAITYASNLLLADTFEGPKYVLLATDGNPNTCVTLDPQCGQDRAIKAAQDAYAAGVGLLVLGVGDLVTQPNSGCFTQMDRCGLLHLQDLANAGVGAGVMPPPGCDDPTSAYCPANYDACNLGAIIASYTPDAPNVGTPFAVDTTGASAASELITALSTLLDGVTSCSVELSSPLAAPPASVVVKIDDVVRAYGGDNGWNLGADQRRITFQGSACTAFRNGGAVSVVVPCD